MDDTTCPICTLKYTSVKRLKISCPRCGTETCIDCFKHWVLETALDPHCMNAECKVGISYEFLTKHVPNSWLNGKFKNRLKEIIIERERSLLPETLMKLVENRKLSVSSAKAMKLEFNITCLKNKINIQKGLLKKLLEKEINTEVGPLLKEKNQVAAEKNAQLKASNKVDPLVFQKWIELKEATSKMNLDIIRYPEKYGYNKCKESEKLIRWERKLEKFEASQQAMRQSYTRVYNINPVSGSVTLGSTVEQKKKKYPIMIHCSMGNCRGYLNKKYVCLICGVKHCPNCREKIEESGHECDPEVAKNIAAIESETKNCPSCGAPIFKLPGCNDMWCWACHTPFNWRTGEIVQSNSNPHLWEWLRENNRENPTDNTGYGFNTCLRRITALSTIGKQSTSEIHNLTTHIYYSVMPLCAAKDPAVAGEKLRMDYLQNRFTETTWKTQCVRIYKQNEKNLELRQILHVFIEASLGIMERAASQPGVKKRKILLECERELLELRRYTNEVLGSIFKRYGGTNPWVISDEWKINAGMTRKSSMRRRALRGI